MKRNSLNSLLILIVISFYLLFTAKLNGTAEESTHIMKMARAPTIMRRGKARRGSMIQRIEPFSPGIFNPIKHPINNPENNELSVIESNSSLTMTLKKISEEK